MDLQFPDFFHLVRAMPLRSKVGRNGMTLIKHPQEASALSFHVSVNLLNAEDTWEAHPGERTTGLK